MKVFGRKIGIVVASSASLVAEQETLNTPLQVINFLYSGDFTSSLESGSLASIDAVINNTSSNGASGELLFRLSDPSNLSTSGSTILRMFHTGSNKEPRVGVGFEETETLLRPFEVKSKIDSTEGTEILLRSSRVTEGAQAGDQGPSINFVIDSSSFNDITTTGSLGRIRSIVDAVSPTEGVGGRLLFSVQRNIDTSVNMLEMGYGGGSYAQFYRTFTSRSFEIADNNPQTEPTHNASFVLSNGTNPYVIIRTDNPGTGDQGGLVQLNNKFGTGSIFLHGPTGEITASSLTLSDSFQYNNVILESTESTISAGNTTLGEFPTASYKALHIDYLIISGSSKARAGHLISTWKGTDVTFTDTSAKGIGDTSDAEFSVVLNGANADLKITSSDSYDVTISSRGTLDGTTFALGGGNLSSSPFPFSGAATITGSLDITGSIIPGGDGIYDLGDATHFWRTASIEHIVTLGDTIEFRDKGNKNTKRGTLKLDEQGGLKVRGSSNALTIVSASHGHFTRDMKVVGNLAISGIPNVSSSIAEAAASIETSSFATTGSNTFVGTQRFSYTTSSIVYDGSNITQVTSSFTDGTEQITNITYDGSNVDTIVITGSDGINKLYTLSYDGSGNVTNIIVS